MNDIKDIETGSPEINKSNSESETGGNSRLFLPNRHAERRENLLIY